MNTKPEHLGAFVIVVKENEVLLGKRKNSYRSGVYGCPGGRLELTESIEDCAKRELEEECGVKALSLKYLGVVRELQEGYNFIHFCFVCTKYQGEIQVVEPDKSESWDFYPTNQFPENILPAHLAGINLLENPAESYLEILKK